MSDVEFEGITKLKRRINSNLVKLLHMNIIDKEELGFLKPMSFKYLYLDGLLKARKLNVASHSILSTYQSPAHSLAKWLTELLGRIQRCLCKYSLGNSTESVEYLDHINIRGKKM